MTKETLHELMEQLGPLLELDDVSEADDQARWFFYKDGEAVECDFDPDTSRLTLSSEFGEVPEDRKLKLYELMLQFNNLWHATGGYRVALDSQEKTAVLIADVPSNDLDITHLSDVVEECFGKARIWARILQQEPGAPARGDEAPMDELTFLTQSFRA